MFFIGLVPDERVLVVIGDPDLGADEDHQVVHGLRVVDHQGLDGPVQHPDLQETHLASVLERVLKLEIKKLVGAKCEINLDTLLLEWA